MNHSSRILVSLLACVLALSCGNQKKLASSVKDDIVVLYENDVHCAVDGYAAFAALKAQTKLSHRFVTTVSGGDFIQGGSLGAASHGRYMIDIMNEVGYDFVILGNHEFDYGIPRQQELMKYLTAECLCCNLVDLRTGTLPYKPYAIVDYEGFKLAFVGMTTPYTINTSNPSYFKDEKGAYIYDFCSDNYCLAVQDAVDKARKEGADFVIALSHIGDESEGAGLFNSIDMVAGTSGINLVIDAHSHTIEPSRIEKNLKGEDVVITSTGTKFQRMGVLTIHRDGTFETELLETSAYPFRDSWIEKTVTGIKDGYKKIAEQVIFTSDVPFSCFDDEGKRLVRNRECSIGNFTADAFRTVLDTDIGMVGGGSIRAGLPQGNVTFNDIYTMFPFENTGCKVTLTGALLLDILECSVCLAPNEYGGFQHVSGLKFEYDPSVPTPARFDFNHSYLGIEGPRRVKNVFILDKASGDYRPLDPAATYTLAVSSYMAKNCGDGLTMMKECLSVEDTGILDTDIVQTYVENYKNRHTGPEYAGPDGRITVARVQSISGS